MKLSSAPYYDHATHSKCSSIPNLVWALGCCIILNIPFCFLHTYCAYSKECLSNASSNANSKNIYDNIIYVYIYIYEKYIYIYIYVECKCKFKRYYIIYSSLAQCERLGLCKWHLLPGLYMIYQNCVYRLTRQDVYFICYFSSGKRLSQKMFVKNVIKKRVQLVRDSKEDLELHLNL